MKAAVVNFLVGLCMLLFISPCFGADFNITPLAKADIDECYNGMGEPYIEAVNGDCDDDLIPKANQSYLWGLTKSGNNLWIGTGANILCSMRALPNLFLDPLGTNNDDEEDDLWVCEYNKGQYPVDHIDRWIPRSYGDFREPKVYRYNLAEDKIYNITDKIQDADALSLLENTYGMRSAAAFGNLVFMAGPIGLGKGIAIYVFDARNDKLIDSKKITIYSNIRKWLVMNGALYTTVENSKGGGGRILRWTGTESNPIQFEEVGNIDTAGAEIAEHNGRIYVATWPQQGKGLRGPLAGIWMSPQIVDAQGNSTLAGGVLTQYHADKWTKVWETDEFEPDPVVAHLYGVGALHSYQGKLYWGTMHVSSYVFRLILTYAISPTGWAEALDQSRRAISIFRTKDFEDVELLYGDPQLPVYTKSWFFGGSWSMKDNNMGGKRGVYGYSGFGNRYNNYTWTMAVYNNKLYVGTMDNSILWKNVDDNENPGADLWCFPSKDSKAVAVTEDGFGNFTNYGVRTIYADQATGLYCGTANPANIGQDEYGEPIGGWELIKVTEAN